MPYFPQGEEEGQHYEIFSLSEKTVMDYTRLNFLEIEQLPIDVYLGLQRDAYIYNLNKTESGREYLENCWIMEQTNPDRKRLREKFGKPRKEGEDGEH